METSGFEHLMQDDRTVKEVREKKRLEKGVERYLITCCKKEGWRTIKLTQLAGIMDRLLILPKGICVFVEMKRKGEKPRKLQLVRKKELEQLDHLVFILDNKEDIKKMIKDLKLYYDI